MKIEKLPGLFSPKNSNFKQKHKKHCMRRFFIKLEKSNFRPILGPLSRKLQIEIFPQKSDPAAFLVR